MNSSGADEALPFITQMIMSRTQLYNMIKNVGFCFLSMLVCLLCAFQARAAQPVKVTARLDTATLLMGRTTRLNVSVEKPADAGGHLPLFADGDPRPYVALLGDSLELSKTFTTDTVRLAGNLNRITYHIPVQAFDSGSYTIPGLQYVVDNDTSYSNPVTLKVVPTDVAKDAKMSDYSDPASPGQGSWLDQVPDWVIQYWWAILAAIALLAALFFLVRSYLKKRRSRPVRKSPLSPYKEALRALDRLKAKELWQKGQNEQYFVELTDILRRYLNDRFRVAAPEMTTEQFLDAAAHNENLTAYAAEFRRLLELADFIKFAKGQSIPAENEEAFAIVRKFVEGTRPTPQEQAELREEPGEKETVTAAKLKKQQQKTQPTPGKGTAHQKGKEARP